MNNNNKVYTGTYKVIKMFRKSGRKVLIDKGLTMEEAKRVVNRYPDSNTHIVMFVKQFSADKYYTNE